jgi:hypothetical protein
MEGDGRDLIERIDAAIRELQVVRAELASQLPAVAADRADGVDDLAPENLLDTCAAQERFGFPADTIRKWCRTEGLGVMRGGRWLVSTPRLRRRLNGNSSPQI